jgi:hypothetical protein
MEEKREEFECAGSALERIEGDNRGADRVQTNGFHQRSKSEFRIVIRGLVVGFRKLNDTVKD